jgi:uncharacterized protein YtpQ (UPF0354 family)
MPASVFRRKALASLALLPVLAAAQSADVDTTVGNLMVVLRETFNGPVLRSESLQYMGKGRAKLPDGKEVEIEQAHYAYLGDMHLRFVFDGPTSMRNASPQDLERLRLSPEEALRVAIANIRRVYGPPAAKPFTAGLLEVDSKSPDLISSYFLDKQFWDELLAKYPEGIVAAVPRRGGLAFAPYADSKGVATLRKAVAHLHASSDRLRVSSALYLYKNGAWTVFQDPVPTK